MEAKETLHRLIKKEEAYLDKLEIGSEEYVKCLARLQGLNKDLADADKSEKEDKSAKVKNYIEIGKVVTSVGLGLFSMVYWVANERDLTVTGVCKETVKMFLPGNQKKF